MGEECCGGNKSSEDKEMKENKSQCQSGSTESSQPSATEETTREQGLKENTESQPTKTK